jgi:hypothetical protein
MAQSEACPWEVRVAASCRSEKFGVDRYRRLPHPSCGMELDPTQQAKPRCLSCDDSASLTDYVACWRSLDQLNLPAHLRKRQLEARGSTPPVQPKNIEEFREFLDFQTGRQRF